MRSSSYSPKRRGCHRPPQRHARISHTMEIRHTASHWGSIKAKVNQGRLIAVAPFDEDRNPSPMIEAMVAAVYDRTRVSHPMVRSGYLAKGPDSDRSPRGTEAFVPVSW